MLFLSLCPPYFTTFARFMIARQLFNPLETASACNLSYMNRTADYVRFGILFPYRIVIASENGLMRNFYAA
jgi:hypothetical protein